LLGWNKLEEDWLGITKIIKVSRVKKTEGFTLDLRMLPERSS
jgi:hypothetical protein